MRIACITSLLAALSAVEAHSTLQRRQTYPPSADFIVDDTPSEPPAPAPAPAPAEPPAALSATAPAVPDPVNDFFRDAPEKPSGGEAANNDLPVDDEEKEEPFTEDDEDDTPKLRSGPSDDAPRMDGPSEEHLVMDEFFRQGPGGSLQQGAGPTPLEAAPSATATSPSAASGMAPTSSPKPITSTSPVAPAQTQAAALPPSTPPSSTGPSNTTCFSELFVYGDSLSETGNVFKLTGKQFPPSPPYHNGRLSNGPIWSEFVAGTLKTPLTTWAYAGSTIDNTLVKSNVVGINIPVPSVYDQVLLSLVDHPPAESPDRLYAIWVGGNDFVNTGFKPNTTALIEKMEMIVSTLAIAGARHVMVFGLPPIGDTPLGASQGGAPISAITNKFSDDLKTAIGSIKGKIANANPNFNFYFVDMVSIFKDLVGSPEYGFTNPGKPCLDQNGAVCTDPDTYIFFDSLHPTTRFHKFLAKRVMKDTLGISDLPGYNQKCVGETKAKVCFSASASMVLRKKNELKKCVNTCVA